jgi:hypothetical protein
VRAWDVAWRRRPCCSRTRARVRVELEDEPDRQAQPVSGREKGRRELARGWAVGLGERRRGAGCWTGPRGGGKKGKKEGQLGCAARKKKREGKRKRKRDWAGLKEKKREKKNCVHRHLNLNLKFKFK